MCPECKQKDEIIAALLRRREAVTADTKRIDWLETHVEEGSQALVHDGYGSFFVTWAADTVEPQRDGFLAPTFREAIDAAIGAETGKGAD